MSIGKRVHTAVVTVAVLLVSLKGASASLCSNEGGTCKDVSLCPSTTVQSLCPGAANIRCCYPGQGAACTVTGVGSGTCLVQGHQTCSGTFYKGYCTGPAAVKCCVKSTVVPPTPSWADKVAIPSTRNTGLTALTPFSLTLTFGKACTQPNVNCANKGLNARLVKNLRTKADNPLYAVIPFNPRMIKPAMDALARIFAKVLVEQPDLYAVVKTAGSLCCRNIKLASGGLSSSLSLHSWGTAVDLTIGSKPADRGLDGKTYKGIVALAPYFEAEMFYWGASFQDAMHWEVSKQLFAKWKKNGEIAL